MAIRIAESDGKGGKRAHYTVLTPEQKSRIGKYAAQNGTTNAIRRFAKEVPQLKESTVRDWKISYVHEITRKTRDNEIVKMLALNGFPKD